MRVAKTVIRIISIIAVFIILTVPAYALDPIVQGVNPEVGNQGEFLQVLIFGGNFESGCDVMFSNPGIAVSNVTYLTEYELQADIAIDPYAEPGLCDVIVENPAGEQGVLTNGFDVIDIGIPFLDYLSPDNGYVGEMGISATLYGDEFISLATFDFMGNITPEIVSDTYVSPTQFDLVIDIPANVPPGWYDLVVVFSDTPGGPQLLQNAFEVRQNLPELYSLDPGSSFPDVQDLPATVGGINFVDFMEFEFQPAGGPVVTGASFVSDTQYSLTLDIPPDAVPGFYDLAATLPDGSGDFTLPQAFEVIEIEYTLYLEPAPALFGEGGESSQVDFLFGIDSNGFNPVNGPFYLYASEAVDPVSGEAIGLSYIDIAPSLTGELTPGLYEMALLRVVIPYGIPAGDYDGEITFSAPGLGLQETALFTVAVQPSLEEILYPELSRQELEIDLIWPGVPDEEMPEEILEDTPLFEWASSARFFDLYLFDVTPMGDMGERAGAVTFTEPIYIERDIADYMLFYPLGAEPMVPGHVYSWYVDAKDIPSYDPRVVSREPEIIQSEIFYFKYIDITEAAGVPEVLRIDVFPEFIDADLESDYEFEAMLELAGPGFADVNWRVVPSSAAIIVNRGEFAYVTPLKTGFISVIAEAGGESSYGVMRVGGADMEASVNTDTTTIAALESKIDEIAELVDSFQSTGDAGIEAALEYMDRDLKRWKAMRDYQDAERQAYILLEPYLLSGNASLNPPNAGSWLKVEPFPDHITLYVSSRESYDRFLARNIINFDNLQTLLDRTKELQSSTSLESVDAMLVLTELPESITSLMANISYKLNELEDELESTRRALEGDVFPFGQAT